MDDEASSKFFHMKVEVIEEMVGQRWMVGMMVTVDCVEVSLR